MSASKSSGKFNTYLSRRFIVFLFSVLVLVSAGFLLVFFFFYSAQIADERTQASQSVSLLLQSSLERAMLRRDLPGLHDIVKDLGHYDGIEQVLILSPSGEVRFASQEQKVGQQQQQIIQTFCSDCSASRLPVEPVTRFVQEVNGTEVLRTFHPVRNKPECMACHGEASKHPVNGILVVDYKAAPIRQKGYMNILMLMGAGAIALVASALAAWWFMQRYVLCPVQQLDTASKALSQGDLAIRVPINAQDEMGNLAKTFNHMAERLQQSHNALKNREQFLQGILDAVPDGVRVIDPFYQVVVANHAYAELSGYPSAQALRQQYCYKLTYQSETPCPSTLRTCPLQYLSEQQPTVKFIETLQRPDGSSRITEVYAARLVLPQTEHEFLIVESVRDLEKAVQYSHEQKLTALGELAAGVAHEIHNPLASVRIALQVSDQLLKDPETNLEELTDYLHLVDDKVEQCLDVTRRLMRLGTLASNHPELIEVNTVIKETISLLRFEREQLHISEQLNLAEDNPRILAADNDLRMIILNLVQNAFHAMSVNGGMLTITTRKQTGKVIISVEDTGIGIASEVLPHIFDPFFSRRADKKGSGLGLTITHSLVLQHQGSIRITSHRPGKTIFVVSFPDIDSVTEESL